jgi:hypothetical protein
MGVVSLGLDITKEDGFIVLNNAREGKISMQAFHEHLRALIDSHKIPVDQSQISREF